jgi:Fe-S-cluster containining protein
MTVNKPFLILKDWEYEFFHQELVEIRSNRKVLLGSVAYDLKSNTTIVFNYTLDGQDCPFLNDNLCSIYEKRPLVCRQFPCIQNMQSLIFNKQIDLYRNVTCAFEAEDDFPYNIPTEGLTCNDVFQMLKKRYGDRVYYNMANENFNISAIQILVDLEKQGEIKLAKKGYDVRFLLKRIESSQHTGVSTFIQEKTGKDIKVLGDVEFVKSSFKDLQ